MNLIADPIAALASPARAAAGQLARADRPSKDRALLATAASLRAKAGRILEANAADLAAATGLTGSFLDRLTLNPARVEAMAVGVEEIAALPDPVGRVLA